MLPAGRSPSRVSNGSSASRAGTPAPISSLAVRTAVRESSSSASQSERPARTPPSTASVCSIGRVFAVKGRSRSIVTHVGAPQEAVAPRAGRSVQLGHPVGDVVADVEHRVGEGAQRLVQEHDVRTGLEGAAAEAVVAPQLPDLDVVGEQEVDESLGLRIAALAGSDRNHVRARVGRHVVVVLRRAGERQRPGQLGTRRVLLAAPVDLVLVGEHLAAVFDEEVDRRADHQLMFPPRAEAAEQRWRARR